MSPDDERLVALLDIYLHDDRTPTASQRAIIERTRDRRGLDGALDLATHAPRHWYHFFATATTASGESTPAPTFPTSDTIRIDTPPCLRERPTADRAGSASRATS